MAYPTYNASSSDIFSLGMTMLIAGSLTSFEIFYEYPGYNLQLDAISTQLESLR